MMRKDVHYEYEIVGGLDQSVVLKEAPTREKARQYKRDLDAAKPQETHRIVQRRFTVVTKHIR